MSSPHDKNNSETDSFVEAFKAIPPIPKQKHQPEAVAPKPAPQPAEKRKEPSRKVDETHVAALQATEKRKNMASSDLTTPLMLTLNFSSKDLAINREGEMTKTQQDRFNGSCLGTVILAGVIAFLVWVTYTVAASHGPRLITLIMMVFTVGVFAIGGSEIEKRRKSFKGHVLSYTGRVRKHANAKEFILIVINHTDKTERIFPVLSQVYNAFIDGETYTLYMPSVAPTTFLSAEHIPTSPLIDPQSQGTF
jgi:hypothetical protein